MDANAYCATVSKDLFEVYDTVDHDTYVKGF